MFTLLTQGAPLPELPKEGDIYKELCIRQISFTIPYGYYEEFERHSRFNDPVPIYPDFIKKPVYTEDGIPFVTAMQDTCRHFIGKPETDGESCLDCTFFRQCEDLIGLCACIDKKKSTGAEP